MSLNFKQTASCIGICILFVSLTGCVSQKKATPINLETLTGHWYGQSKSDNVTTLWLTERTKAGTYSTHFKQCKNGKTLFFQVKSGDWTLKGKSYSTITKELSDGQHTWEPATANREFVESYYINSLTADKLVYTSNGVRYSVAKVAADFQLNCPK